MGTLDDKVVVVLGGTGGLGLALSRGLAEAGATVIPSSRDRDRVQAAVEALDADVPVIQCDTTEDTSVVVLRDEVLGRFGRVDGLVHAAGIHRTAPAIETPTEAFRHVVDVNLTGTFVAARTFAVPMIERGHGRIVAISSMGASVALREAAAYCASKAGVEALVRVMASEWAEHGVTVNALAPGFFLTDLNADILAEGTARRARIDDRTPFGRVGQPEELVGAVTYLCSDSAGFTTGEVLHVDGGFLSAGI